MTWKYRPGPPPRLSTPSKADPDSCGNCDKPLIKSGGTKTHTDRSVLCDPPRKD